MGIGIGTDPGLCSDMPSACWDAAEPGKGYAEKAAEWRTKLKKLQATKPRSDAATEGKDDPGKP